MQCTADIRGVDRGCVSIAVLEAEMIDGSLKEERNELRRDEVWVADHVIASFNLSGLVKEK